LVIAMAIAAMCLLVIAATDEESRTLGARLGRLAALAAASGGLGAFIASQQARARGELRALFALGVAPLKASLGAAVGGAIVGALGPLLVLMPSIDIAPLFPRLAMGPSGFRPVGPEAWLDAARGVLIRASGELGPMSGAIAPTMTAVPAPRVAAAVSLAVAAVALPLWGTADTSGLRRAVVAVAAALVGVVAFHLVAASRGPAWLLVLPPLLVLSDVWVLERSRRCS
jgi:hypothetical protein